MNLMFLMTYSKELYKMRIIFILKMTRQNNGIGIFFREVDRSVATNGQNSAGHIPSMRINFFCGLDTAERTMTSRLDVDK